MKNVVKIISFVAIFLILFKIVFNVLWLEKTSINYFYEEPKNSLDIVYVGSSNVISHFNPTLAYNEYGFTTGLFAYHSQSFLTVKYFIEEAKKYQNPKIFVIDLGQILNDNLPDEGRIRNGVDSMKFSLNRLNLINELLENNGENNKNYINYYFSFVLYHNKWKDVFKGTAKRERNDLYKGYSFSEKIVKYDDYEWNNDIIKLSNFNEKALLDLLKYIKDNDLNVLFIIPARTYDNGGIKKLNYAKNLIERENYQVINFNNLEDFKIDYKTELCDYAHLNVYGATKFTLYFGKYLKENYDLNDCRNIYIYNSWKSEYERFKKNFNSYVKKDFDTILLKYKNNISD